MTEPKFKTVQVVHKAFSDDRHVANVKVDADITVVQQLEQAYRATQNIYGSWSKGPELEPGVPNRDYNPFITWKASLVNDMGHRSTSIDDWLIVDGVIWVVDTCGFRLLNTPADRYEGEF